MWIFIHLLQISELYNQYQKQDISDTNVCVSVKQHFILHLSTWPNKKVCMTCTISLQCWAHPSMVQYWKINFNSSATHTCIKQHQKYDISTTNVKLSMWYHDKYVYTKRPNKQLFITYMFSLQCWTHPSMVECWKNSLLFIYYK